MIASPQISVFIPVWNGANWIRDTIESLLNQTLPPMEILIGDDGSTDDTAEIAQSLSSPLVRVVRSEQRIGISRQCNELVSLAAGRYLARMDADDLCDPDKFRIQMDVFQTSDVSVLGTWARRFEQSNMVHQEPVAHDDILAKMGVLSPFVNPTVVFDRERLKNGVFWDPEIEYGGDYDCFVRLRNTAKFGNVPKVLLYWRLHGRNVGANPETRCSQLETVSSIRNSIWAKSGIVLSDQERQAIDQLVQLPVPEICDANHLLSAFMKAVHHPDDEMLWAPRAAIRGLFQGLWDYYCHVRAWGATSMLPIWWKGAGQLERRRDLKMVSAIAVKSLLRKR